MTDLATATAPVFDAGIFQKTLRTETKTYQNHWETLGKLVENGFYDIMQLGHDMMMMPLPPPLWARVMKSEMSYQMGDGGPMFDEKTWLPVEQIMRAVTHYMVHEPEMFANATVDSWRWDVLKAVCQARMEYHGHRGFMVMSNAFVAPADSKKSRFPEWQPLPGNQPFVRYRKNGEDDGWFIVMDKICVRDRWTTDHETHAWRKDSYQEAMDFALDIALTARDAKGGPYEVPKSLTAPAGISWIDALKPGKNQV